MVNVVYSEPVSKIVDVTPEMASQFLMHNVSNRPINRNDVKKYADNLKNGQHVLLGDAIMFGKDGELYNGQHRLTAIVESGITAKMLILFGVDKEARYKQNTGRKVTNRDMGVMFLAEENLSPDMYSVAEFVMNYLYYGKDSYKICKIPPEIIEKFVHKYIKIFKEISKRPKRSIFTNSRVALAKEALHRMIDETKAENFYTCIYEQDCRKDTPEHAVMTFLNDRKLGKDQRWAAKGEKRLNSVLNYAFNRYLQNKKMNRFRINDKDGNPAFIPFADPNGNLERISDDVKEMLKDVYMN